MPPLGGIFLNICSCKLSFGRNMVQWLMWCVSTASIVVVLNGVPIMLVPMERSLRQGDPISSFFFIIIGEYLNFIFNEATSKSLILCVPIGYDNVSLTHPQYADDTLIFLPQNSTTILNYRRLFDCCSLMTCLNINFSKSILVL